MNSDELCTVIIVQGPNVCYQHNKVLGLKLAIKLSELSLSHPCKPMYSVIHGWKAVEMEQI